MILNFFDRLFEKIQQVIKVAIKILKYKVFTYN